MISDPEAASAAIGEGAGSAGPARRKRARGIPFKILIPAVIALDVARAHARPALPEARPARRGLRLPRLLHRRASIEFPPPAVVLDLAPSAESGPPPMVYFHPSISSTILTMWLVMALILLLAFVATRGMKVVPGRVQNAVEWAFELGPGLRRRHRRRAGPRATTRSSPPSSC